MEIIITLTEAEYKALAYVAADPADWIQNAATVRAQLGMDELFQAEMQRMIADPSITSIPADKEAVVLASTLPSAAERNAQVITTDLAAE